MSSEIIGSRYDSGAKGVEKIYKPIISSRRFFTQSVHVEPLLVTFLTSSREAFQKGFHLDTLEPKGKAAKGG